MILIFGGLDKNSEKQPMYADCLALTLSRNQSEKRLVMHRHENAAQKTRSLEATHFLTLVLFLGCLPTYNV